MKFFLNPISFHLTGQTTPWIQRTNALSVINIMENKKMVLSLLKTVKTIQITPRYVSTTYVINVVGNYQKKNM